MSEDRLAAGASTRHDLALELLALGVEIGQRCGVTVGTSLGAVPDLEVVPEFVEQT